jgi:hypothetical protein
MSAAAVLNAAEPHLNRLCEIINDHLLDDGDKETDSQRICLLNRLASLEQAFNGVKDEDCIDPINPPPHSC